MLNRMIGRWESDLTTMSSFRGAYREDLARVKKWLKELQRSVGQKPGDLSSVNIIGSMRPVVEAVLAHLARWMRKDPGFDPATLSQPARAGQKMRSWPNVVLDELRSEMRAEASARKLDNFYHQKLSGIGSWAVRHDTNIERLCKNLKDRRDYSHKVRTPPTRSQFLVSLAFSGVLNRACTPRSTRRATSTTIRSTARWRGWVCYSQRRSVRLWSDGCSIDPYSCSSLSLPCCVPSRIGRCTMYWKGKRN